MRVPSNLIDRAALTVAIEREFAHPRELVFRAWSSCEHVAHWFGPAGWTLPVCEMDFRPGGRWRFGMDQPDSGLSHGLAIYDEIVEPSRIVYHDYFAHEDGSINEAMPAMWTEVDLHDLGGRTRLVNTTHFASLEDLEKVIGMGAEAGMAETFDRLEAYLTDLDT